MWYKKDKEINSSGTDQSTQSTLHTIRLAFRTIINSIIPRAVFELFITFAPLNFEVDL